MGTHPIFESDFDCLTECQPVHLHRSGDFSTADKKSESPRTPKAADVAKVPEPMMEKHHSGKTPFCVDNRLIESKQDMELETRIKVRSRVEFKEVQINADCICVERK